MRKVFLSNIILNEVKNTKYVSDDFKLPKRKYDFLLSYFVDMNVLEGEEVAIITCYTPEDNALKNYNNFQNEISQILEKRNIKLEFIGIEQNIDFNSLTFNVFFKKVVKLFKDDDILFVDLTFGMKPYSISLFTAAAYAVRACKNVRVETIVYAQKYRGQSQVNKIEQSKIYDITSLFFLNEIAGNLHPGEKASADRVLDILISDKE